VHFGVPGNHQFADLNSPSGFDLYNLKIGHIKLPAAPTFTFHLKEFYSANQVAEIVKLE